MIQNQPAIYPSLAALADPLRCRLLLLLERRELSVAELVQATQLPQSSISRHLKALADEGFVSSREEGASNRYTMPVERLRQPVKKLWQVVREQTAGLAAAGQDARRLSTVLSERRSRAQEYFSSAAGQWDRIRRDLFGESAHLHALLALLDRDIVVGDIGCGTGLIAQLIAPFVKRVIAIDDSAAMLSAARKRLAGTDNVELRRGDAGDLPLRGGELDVAILFLVLPYFDNPEIVLRSTARALRRGGKLLLVDMQPHDRGDIAHEMGHVWRGFSEEQILLWMGAAGFKNGNYSRLPPDPAAKGPDLFVAVAKKGGSAVRSNAA